MTDDKLKRVRECLQRARSEGCMSPADEALWDAVCELCDEYEVSRSSVERRLRRVERDMPLRLK